MLRSLYPTIDWSTIQIIGFDLDGTLYDEFDFIAQVYCPISQHLAQSIDHNVDIIYQKILARWVEMGSSYNKIFEEVLLDAGKHPPAVKHIISECLDIYHSFSPKLTLSPRVRFLLNFFSVNKQIFLVTDGKYTLQTNKINSLGLREWFDCKNISISSSLGALPKPNIEACSKIALLNDKSINPNTVLYFGDRSVDAIFAHNCGFQFLKVNRMIPAIEEM